jgi:acyl transferase domain-containing protein
VTQPAYWVDHLRQPVRFATGIQTLAQLGCGLFLECSPSPVLLGMARRCLPDDLPLTPRFLPSLRPNLPDYSQLLHSLGQLYACGVDPDWRAVDQAYSRQKVVLPTYPFQRQRCWVELPPADRRGRGSLRPLLDTLTRSPLLQQVIGESRVGTASLPYLADHKVFGQMVAPGACQLAMVLNGADEAYHVGGCTLEDIVWQQPLLLNGEQSEREQVVQVGFSPLDGPQNAPAKVAFEVISLGEGGADIVRDSQYTTHVTGQLVLESPQRPAPAALDELRKRCRDEAAAEDFYSSLSAQEIELGPAFRWLTHIWRGDNEVLARVRIPASVEAMAGYVLHPGLLDACFQLAGAILGVDQPQETLVPFAVQSIRVHQAPSGQTWWGHAQSSDGHKWQIRLLDSAGQILVEIAGFELRPAHRAAIQGSEAWHPWLYSVNWQPVQTVGLRPDYLPQPLQLQTTLSGAMTELAKRPDLPAYAAAQTALEALAVDYVVAALTRLGVTFQLGTRWRTDQLAGQISVIPQHRRLLARLLHLLAEAGILQVDRAQFEVVQTPALLAQSPDLAAALDTKVAALRAKYAAVAEPEVILLQRCGVKLAEVLRGVQDPLALLFPRTH